MSCLYHTLYSHISTEQLNIAISWGTLRSLREGNLTKENWVLGNTKEMEIKNQFPKYGKVVRFRDARSSRASVPTAQDQGQVASKMIYLHVRKPHSLTQMPICSKKKTLPKKSISIEEQRTATLCPCWYWGPAIGLGRICGLTQGCCKARTLTLSFSCNNLRVVERWLQVRNGKTNLCEKLQASCRVAAILPGMHTHVPLLHSSCKIQLQQTVKCWFLTCCSTMSQDQNTM